MQYRGFRRSAIAIATLSMFIVSLGCESGTLASDSDLSTELAAARRRPKRDAGTAPAPSTDAGSTGAGSTDAGTMPAPIDAGVDAGSVAVPSTRPFSDTSPWNTRIPAGVALRPDSSSLVSHLSTSSVWPGLSVNIYPWSVPVYEVDSSVPLVRVYTPLSNEGENMTFYWPVPAGAQPAPEADGHMTLVDQESGRGYDFYQARRRTDGAWDCTLCATTDLRGTGVRPPKGGSTPWYESHGSRACGFPLIAGLITVDELRAGRIDHALVIAYPGIRQRYFTSPASTGHPANGIISQDRGIPCGGRVQLDPSVNIDALGLSPAGRTIARALQEYGAYVGDFSESINVYADGSDAARAVWSSGLLTSGATRPIPLDRLRVIEWGTLRTDG